VIARMPGSTDIEKRDRALVAFTLLTGARDGAIASLKLKHIDIQDRRVDQDAREVNTKFSKTFSTWFFPVGGQALEVIEAWVAHLRGTLLWGNDDPLFPATLLRQSETGGFIAAGLSRNHWSSANPIRRIFSKAFQDAELPSFNPHSFRDTIVRLGQQLCKTPEEYKAWSQNLGHERVLTTFTSYGVVGRARQAELIGSIGTVRESESLEGIMQRLAKLEARP
jgi:integrase